MSKEKIVEDIRLLTKILLKEKRAGRRIAFTNGCFDLIHVGHIKLLEEAKRQGDILVVAINSDDSVRRLKGEDRPIFPASERAEILASIQTVDYVTIFDEDDPQKIISLLKPDVLVKGEDCYSTSKIIQKIKERG